MSKSWGLFTQIVAGPVFLAIASAFHGWVAYLLLAIGVAATLGAFALTRRDFRRSTAEMTAEGIRNTAEGILGTAVEFLNAMGVQRVRAHFMTLDAARQTLSMTYHSTTYGIFERENSWRLGDGSVASTAIESGGPVLGGRPGEYENVEITGTPFRVEVVPMVVLPREKTRSVLCVPVSQHGRGEPVGVITFDDIVPLKDSKLTNPAILNAVKRVADTWLEAVP